MTTSIATRTHLTLGDRARLVPPQVAECGVSRVAHLIVGETQVN